jgi:3-oxoacyl-[acyl-carrier protein] reductase
MMERLEGLVAVISGASRGIGRAIAERFAAEGAKLVLCGRDDAALAEAARACETARPGVEVQVERCDLAAGDAPTALRDATLRRFGRIDVLVNNAAITMEGLLAECGDDELAAMLATNVSGLVRLTRAVLRPMIRQRAGAIINVSSVMARRPGRGNVVYAGTKGFVESFTRALAVEVGRKQIRVNAVAPGVIETDMSRAVRALAGEELRGRVSLGRFGRPDEIAAVVVFLASAEAAYVNGAVIAADGGYG